MIKNITTVNHTAVKVNMNFQYPDDIGLYLFARYVIQARINVPVMSHPVKPKPSGTSVACPSVACC